MRTEGSIDGENLGTVRLAYLFVIGQEQNMYKKCYILFTNSKYNLTEPIPEEKLCVFIKLGATFFMLSVLFPYQLLMSVNTFDHLCLVEQETNMTIPD